MYRECPRKWAWKYIAKIETEQTDRNKLGDDVDERQLQPYLRDGRPFDYTLKSAGYEEAGISAYIADSGLSYLPKPQLPGLEVQKHFVIPSPGSTPGRPAPFGYQGYLDLWVPDARLMPAVAFDPKNGPPPGDWPCVGDFKTTKNINRPWVKTRETLATDVQAQLYAAWAMYSTGKRTVDLVWIYFQTEGARKAKPVHLRVYGQDVLPQLLAIDATATEMFGIRQSTTDPLTLPPNPDMCEAFGGCPYRPNCNLDPGQIADAIAALDAQRRLISNPLIAESRETPMSTTANLFKNLAAKRAAAAPAPAPAPLPANAPVAPRQEVMGCAADAVPAAPVDMIPAGLAAPFAGINPPEKNLAPPPAADAAPKRGPGRPPKNAAKADAPAPEAKPSSPDVGMQIKVVWGAERFEPLPGNSYEVGPFEALGIVQEGESYAGALARVEGALTAFAVQQRALKAANFAAEIGGGE